MSYVKNPNNVQCKCIFFFIIDISLMYSLYICKAVRGGYSVAVILCYYVSYLKRGAFSLISPNFFLFYSLGKTVLP